MNYHIEYTRPAERFIRKLDRTTQDRILNKIERIAENPRAVGSIKLSGHDSYRARVGDYRIIYDIVDERLLVLVVDVGHRRDIYRNL